MDINNTTRKCLNCGKEVKGRKDKKFCNDGCRNTFHNDLTSPTRDQMNPVINILKRNRTILFDFLNKGNVNDITREQLEEAGYELPYCTEYHLRNDRYFFFCFDVGLSQVNTNFYQFHYRIEFDFGNKIDFTSVNL